MPWLGESRLNGLTQMSINRELPSDPEQLLDELVKKKQEGLPICGGSAKRDVTRPTATVVNNTCHNLFRKRSCITIGRDNNRTPAIYVMHESLIKLEYNHCNERE